MSKKWLEMMYDAANVQDENGLNKMDEQKLRRYLESNEDLFARNKDMFEKYEKNFFTCLRYNPCPICDKCLNKASHLYVKCQICQIPICTHTYKDKEKMIKRKNFRHIVTEEVYDELVQISDEVFEEIHEKLTQVAEDNCKENE